ncbi:MAG: UPF0175 family protein [Bryobacteraceae bacterium]
MRAELAIALYAQGILSFGKASELAGVSRFAFAELIGQRGNSTPLYERRFRPRPRLCSRSVIRLVRRTSCDHARDDESSAWI